MSSGFPISMLAAVEDGRWAPGLGDPTAMGWATVAAYLAASLLCLLWAKPSGSGRFLPVAFAGAMALLAVNKQLDLQSLLTEIARDAAKAQGWYEDRQTYQAIFIGVIGSGAALGFAALLWMLRRRWKETALASAGFACLLAFVVVRAASFHHVDQGLGETWVGLRFNWILELGGIALVVAGAVVGWRVRRSRVPGTDPVDAEPIAAPVAADEPASVAGPFAASSPASAHSPAARAGALDGFVVRPIRLSNGPKARGPESERAATTPPAKS